MISMKIRNGGENNAETFHHLRLERVALLSVYAGQQRERQQPQQQPITPKFGIGFDEK